MDFGIRELLMIIGALIFLGVLLDGVRRFHNNRKSQIKLALDPKAKQQANEEDELDWYRGELPGGGARVIDDRSKASNSKIAPRFSEPEDVLMSGYDTQKTVAENDFHQQEKTDEKNPEDVVTEESTVSQKPAQLAVDNHQQDTHEAVIQQSETAQHSTSETQAPTGGKKPRPGNKVAAREQPDLFSSEEKPKHEDSMVVKNSELPEEILAINVIAKGDQHINGAELLEAILAYGLRFGDMDIFHRHEHSNGQGAVIFSMANALNPGTFDIDALPDAQVKGVTFFMRLSQLNKRMFVLELMLDIAKRLANQLGAELKDDARSALTSQTVTHYKSRIQEYERKHLGQVLRN